MPALNIPFGLSVLGAFLASTVVGYTYVWPAAKTLATAVPIYLRSALSM